MAAGKKVALIIGNSNYINGSSLPNPMNDAALVAKTAMAAGFEVTQVNNLNADGFHKALTDFQAKADTAEVSLVYYAGHGIENNLKNWLIPTDAILNDPRDLQRQAISFDEVLNTVALSKYKIILLDACRDDPYKAKWSNLTRSFAKGLAAVDVGDGSIVLFATDAGATVNDGGPAGNSYFATAISKNLAKPGEPLSKLANNITGYVSMISGGQQRPKKAESLPVDYTLIPVIAEDSSEYAVWGKATSLNTVPAYQGYLDKFPNGQFKNDALTSIRVLSRGRPSAAPPPPEAPSPAPPPQPAEQSPQAVPQSQPAYAPPAIQQPVAGPVNQAPESAPVQQNPQVAQQPANPAPVYGPVAPPIVFNPAPQAQPQPAPVFTQQPPAPAQTQAAAPYTLPPAQPPVTQAPVSAAPQTAVQSGTYVAPPIQRRYSAGGFPVMPEPPAFDYGPYPTCKDNWLALTDPMARVNATIACGNAFTDYQTNWLNKYRVAMNAYGTAIGDIYTNEVAPPHFPANAAEQGQFYQEMDRRISGVKDGGFLMADYEKAKARFKADSEAVKDTYYRATGCKGYPVPAGLAPNPNC